VGGVTAQGLALGLGQGKRQEVEQGRGSPRVHPSGVPACSLPSLPPQAPPLGAPSGLRSRRPGTTQGPAPAAQGTASGAPQEQERRPSGTSTLHATLSGASSASAASSASSGGPGYTQEGAAQGRGTPLPMGVSSPVYSDKGGTYSDEERGLGAARCCSRSSGGGCCRRWGAPGGWGCAGGAPAHAS